MPAEEEDRLNRVVEMIEQMHAEGGLSRQEAIAKVTQMEADQPFRFAGSYGTRKSP